jgi:hypothetical protein
VGPFGFSSRSSGIAVSSPKSLSIFGYPWCNRDNPCRDIGPAAASVSIRLQPRYRGMKKTAIASTDQKSL